MPLRQLQQDMQRHLLTADLSNTDASMRGAIIDAPPLPAAERLGIYRTAYRVRLIDALQVTYPVLHKILGDEDFFSLSAAFVDDNPSVYRSIRWYGSELANFLGARTPYSDQPIFAEIALLDWTLSEVFDASDAMPIARAALQSIDPLAWSDLTFKFHPSLHRLQFAWNTVAVWQSMSRDESPPDPEASQHPVQWLLWRQNLSNYYRSMDDSEAAALDAAIRGSNFGDICGTLTKWIPEADVPLRAAGLIGSWTDSGIITALSLDVT
jgi:hypothetical protein